MTKYPQKTIGELCNIIKGETGISSATPGEYPLVVTAKERKTSATYQFNTQAVCIPLVSSSGHGKKSLNYVHYQEGKFALATILAAVIPKKHDEIYAAFLNSNYGIRNAISYTTGVGSSQGNLNVNRVRPYVIPLPPLAEQKAIVEKVDYLIKIIDQLEAQIKHRKQLAEELMPTVLTETFE